MLRSRSFGLVALAVVACTPERPPIVPAKPVIAPVAKTTPPVAPVSRWALLDRPARAPRPHGKGAIAVGALGERWWIEGTTHVHAQTFAPGPLVDVLEDKGKLAFVAADGSVLVADEPLGPFGVRRAPPAPLHGVAVGKAAILGIDPRGHVLRSVDAGVSWSELALGTPIAIDVSLDREGKGRAVFAVAAAKTTSDDGATFVTDPKTTATEWPHVARSGWTGLAAWEGKVALSEGQLYRVSSPEPTRAVLETRAFDGQDAPRTLVKLERCDDPVVAARGARVAVGCSVDAKGVTAFVVHASEDAGKTFAPTLSLTRRSMFDPTMWLSEAGTIVVTRVCLPAEPKCAAETVVRIGNEEPMAMKVEAGSVHDLLDVAFVGGQVIALGDVELGGKRTDAVLRSTDGGRTFVAQRLPPYVPPPPLPLVNPPVRKTKFVRMIETGGRDGRGSLAIDAHGKLVAVAVGGGHETDVFGTTDDGATFALRPTPAQEAVAMSGVHGLAHDGTDTFVTSDAGQSWSKLEAQPRSLDPRFIACSSEGCLLSHGVARIGWEGATTTPWKKPPTRGPNAAQTLACKVVTTKSFPGGFRSDERAALAMPQAPLRYAIAFAHQLEDEDKEAVTVALDRGKGLQFEQMLAGPNAENLELHQELSSIGVTRGDDASWSAAWMGASGKIVRSSKKLPSAPVGYDGETALVAVDDRLHRVGPKGLGPAIGPSERNAFYAHSGPDLLRLHKVDGTVHVARLAKGAFVDVRELLPWPGGVEEITFATIDGVPSMWTDQPHAAGALVRLLEKLDVRPVPPLDAVSETICGPAHAGWPRVFLAHLDGQHHGVKLDGALADRPYWLGTDGVLAGIGPSGETCRQALRVQVPWESAVGWISLDDPTRSVIVRMGARERVDVHTITCAPSADTLPIATAQYHGY